MNRQRICSEWPEVKKDEYRGVWVFGEVYKGSIHEASLQMLTPATRVAAKLKTDVTGVVVGYRVKEIAREMSYYGAERVIVVDRPELEMYSPDSYALTIANLARKYKPEMIFIAGTMRGRELAPYIANTLRAGITADCTDFDVDEKTRDVIQIRPPFGAIMLAYIRTPTRRPQLASARPNVFPLPPRNESMSCEVIVDDEVEVPKPMSRLVSVRYIEKKEVPIEKADYIVSGGKGLGGPEGFKLLEDLASIFGGVTAGSRKAVDAGWIPHEKQVGQTGKTVKPILYIAVGISGAAQHVFGIREAHRVVAINIDPEAPIFKNADYGIVGDYREVLPILIEELRRLKARVKKHR